MNTLKKLLTNKIFLIGLLIRLAVMPFTGHYDIRGINFAVYQLPFHHVTDVYKIAESGPIDYIVNVNFGREYFIYPPLTYFTLGSVMWLLSPLYGSGFVGWINGYGNDILRVITHPDVFRYLFLMKIPYLIFDVLMVITLVKFGSTDKEKKKLLAYWWLNPIVIFLPYVWGQFDIIPAFFTVLGAWHMRKNVYLGSFLMGIAAAYKNYPLLFLPLIILAIAKNWKQGIAMFLAGVLPFIATVAPYAGEKFFRDTVLFSWQSQKMLDFMWGIGGDDGIYPFVIGYTIIAFWTFQVARKNKDFTSPIIMSLMWYYATTNFHHQWFMWVLPFLTLYAVKVKDFFVFYAWLVGLFFVRLVEIQANVTTEMFIWLAPAIDDLPKTRTLVGHLYDIHKVRNIVDSFYMASALWIGYQLAAKKEKKAIV